MPLQKTTGAVRLFSRLMKFAGWLQTIPDKLTPPPFRLMQIGSAFWQSRALYVAARLDIATVLGDQQLTAEKIAAQVSAQPSTGCFGCSLPWAFSRKCRHVCSVITAFPPICGRTTRKACAR